MTIPFLGSPGGTVVKNQPAKAADAIDIGSISGSGRSSEVGNGNPLHPGKSNGFP